MTPINFNHDLLAELGLSSVDDETASKLLVTMAETVQNRVAARLGEVLAQKQLDEFERLAALDQDQAMQYLETAVPNYPLLVTEEMERLKAEISQDTAEIMKLAEEAAQS